MNKVLLLLLLAIPISLAQEIPINIHSDGETCKIIHGTTVRSWNCAESQSFPENVSATSVCDEKVNTVTLQKTEELNRCLQQVSECNVQKGSSGDYQACQQTLSNANALNNKLQSDINVSNDDAGKIFMWCAGTAVIVWFTLKNKYHQEPRDKLNRFRGP